MRLPYECHRRDPLHRRSRCDENGHETAGLVEKVKVFLSVPRREKPYRVPRRKALCGSKEKSFVGLQGEFTPPSLMWFQGDDDAFGYPISVIAVYPRRIGYTGHSR